ncbi:MAG: hypothetical protein RL199_768 [Pseudomonadota bacterium]|jgi:hypothetical protein
MAWRGRWTAFVLAGAGLATSCSDDTCSPGDPNCSCTTLANGTVSCTRGICDAARICDGSCCPDGQQCDAGSCVDNANACIYIPGPGEFEPPEKAWWWPYLDAGGKAPRGVELPDFAQVMATPVSLKLRPTDEVPTVVFPTFVAGGSVNVEGVLRAVRGDTGAPVWTVTDPALRVNGVSSPAAADLDGDGSVEVVTGAWDPAGGPYGGLLAFKADGTLLWRAPGHYVGWGGPALADLDADGRPEVVIGNTVLDGATGTERCSGGYTATGDNGEGPLSVVVDVDGDGVMELVAGSMTYHLVKDDTGADRCGRFWPETLKDRLGARLWDGFPAVADIFDDPAVRTTQNAAEVAVVSKGVVRVHDWTGGLLMNPVKLPGGGSGGPPTIADFDGDGRAEIGVAGLGSYTVFKPGRPGNILWTVPTQDVSSSTTGSSVFDFDGNGRAEVVYADECFVHVYDGATGMEVFQVPNSSCTAYEMPVVADVDGDGAAELLVGANDVCAISCPWGTHAAGRLHGLALFKSPSDAWVASRPVWNEHGYHVTNIDDDGRVPAKETRSWGPGTRNSFRQNYQGTGTFAAPNLVLDGVRLDGTACPVALSLVASLHNAGARGVRPGLPVAFYLEDVTGRSLLGVSRVDRRLMPGDTAEATLAWPGPPRLNAAKVVVVVDDNGTAQPPKGEHNECSEGDNTAIIGGVLCREPG